MIFRRKHVLSALVLRVIDIGEADRFCIFLTRERGRLAARAFGARKLRSAFGGLLLPFRHLSLEIEELPGGCTVTSATLLTSLPPLAPHAFCHASAGIELLLGMLQDYEPVPEIFDAALALFSACAIHDARNAYLVFSTTLLQQLGVLPHRRSELFGELSITERSWITSLGQGVTLHPLQRAAIERWIRHYWEEQMSRPLRSTAVSESLSQGDC